MRKLKFATWALKTFSKLNPDKELGECEIVWPKSAWKFSVSASAAVATVQAAAELFELTNSWEPSETLQTCVRLSMNYKKELG